MSRPTEFLSRRAWFAWRLLQTLVWLTGATIMVLLVVQPDLGLVALWNILIPVAPALLVFAPGLWRNICPLGNTALAARHVGLSVGRKLSHRGRVWLHLVGLLALFLIVILRRVGLNTSGMATASVLAGAAVVAVCMGLVFEWKSGWCSSLCPVFGVEKLYGSQPLFSFSNAHCHSCQHCCSPCPDCTDGIHPLIGPRGRMQWLTENLLVGGFPGFVWGWFHVPDSRFSGAGWPELLRAFALPLGGMAVTLAVFVVVRRFVPRKSERRLVRVFAAAAIACYYWYRIPALFGYGQFPDDGVLFDLHRMLPAWWVVVPRLLTTGLFVWWLVLRLGPAGHWLDRPAFAVRKSYAVSLPVCQTQPVEV